ncbi:MAG: hypothetical protein ABI268_09875, partial [Rhodanobacter sp.]
AKVKPGFKPEAEPFTDADVHDMLDKMWKAAQDKGAAAGGDAMSSDEPAKQTDTPEFKRWFGESKVVDAKGEPLVVYHGAPDARFVKQDGTFKSVHQRYGGTAPGVHWFTPDRSVASTYADDRRAFDYQNAESGVVPTYLKMENPLVVDGKGQAWRDAQARGKSSDVIEQAQRDGHDGLIIRNVRDSYGTLDNPTRKDKVADTYAVFDSRQIKHATNNRGTFDPSDPNIMHDEGSQSGEPQMTRDQAIARNAELRDAYRKAVKDKDTAAQADIRKQVVDLSERIDAGEFPKNLPKASVAPPRASERVDSATPPESAPKAVTEPPQAPREEVQGKGGTGRGDTAPRNAAIDEDRAQRSLDALPEAGREHWTKPLNEAMAKIADDPEYPAKLAAVIAAKPRALTTEETMALTQDLRRLNNNHANAVKDVLQARESGDQNAELRALMAKDKATADLTLNHEALRKGGTEAARALSIRNAILKEDYSLGRNMDRAKVSFGDKFTGDVKQKIEDLSARLDQSEKTIRELQANQGKGTRRSMSEDEKMQAHINKKIQNLKDQIEARQKACPI